MMSQLKNLLTLLIVLLFKMTYKIKYLYLY